MNKLTSELLINLKELIELKKLLIEYRDQNPGIEAWSEYIYEYLDAEIVKYLTDIIHLERLI